MGRLVLYFSYFTVGSLPLLSQIYITLMKSMNLDSLTPSFELP